MSAPAALPRSRPGRRTTLRLTAAPFSGFREHKDEAVVATWCPENHKCGLKQELETLLDKKARVSAFRPPTATKRDASCVPSLSAKFQALPDRAATRPPGQPLLQVYPLNPYFWKYVNSVYFRKRGVEVSSGMVAFALLAHHCEQVSLFGFSGADARDWYYVKREDKYKQIAQADWLSNKAWTVDAWKLVKPRRRGCVSEAARAFSSHLLNSPAGVGVCCVVLFCCPRRCRRQAIWRPKQPQEIFTVLCSHFLTCGIACTRRSEKRAEQAESRGGGDEEEDEEEEVEAGVTETDAEAVATVAGDAKEKAEAPDAAAKSTAAAAAKPEAKTVATAAAGEGDGDGDGDGSRPGGAENDEDIMDDDRRRLLQLLSSTDAGFGFDGVAGGAEEWGAPGQVVSVRGRGGRRALLGSFDVERACFAVRQPITCLIISPPSLATACLRAPTGRVPLATTPSEMRSLSTPALCSCVRRRSGLAGR